MSGFFSFFGGGRLTSGSVSQELPNIYPLSVDANVFIRADIIATYTKILTDTFEHTHGIPKNVQPLLWDNCVQSESSKGLISLLVCAMYDQKDLFLVYNKALAVLRVATTSEAERIRSDYMKNNESPLGIFVSFKNYFRTDMLKIYAALEYCILSSLHKTVNISKAVQIKISELRKSVSLADEGIAAAQAQAIAQALAKGSDVYLDKDDEITTATPNIDPTEKAIGFLNEKRAYYLDFPLSYISGEQTAGIGSSGEADMRAVERGLKQYYHPIVHPILLALFGCDTEFRSQDFREISSALEALKTFELVSNDILSTAAKQEITARLFNLDPDEEKAALTKEIKILPQTDVTLA